MSLETPTPAAAEPSAEQIYDQGLDLVAEGNHSAAAARFREALALNPCLLDAMHGLVRALQDSGDYDQALAAAHELMTRDPEDPLAHTSLSILYQHQGMVAEAEAASLKAKLLGWKRELRESQTNAAATPPSAE